jgi:hypothetical protein
MDGEGANVDYKLLGQLDTWNNKLLPLLSLLQFADLSALCGEKNEAERLAFFINIYNILNIHSLVVLVEREKK